MFDNLNSTLKKVVVIFLIITLTYANLVLIGTNIVQGLFSYALEETEEQNLVVANQELVMNKVYGEGEEQKRIIQVAVETGIESEEYPIKTSEITLGTDIIEEALLDVKVTELNKNSYTTGTWEVSEEGKLIISLVNENETLETKEKGLDKFLVTYVFKNSEVETINKPLESVEITGYVEEVLTNEYTTTNFEEINVEKELSLLNIENKDIHKTTIESGKVDYTENLNLDLSHRNDVTNITIQDLSNDFYNIDEQQNEEVTLKYNNTVLNRDDLNALLGETGKLVITDNETSKELIALTKEKLTMEGSEKQYYGEDEEQELRTELSVKDNEVIIEYSIDVASITINLIDIVPQSNVKLDISDFVIKNTKSILNVNDLENLSHLQENVKYVVNEEKIAESTIKFKDTVTRANLTVDNTEWALGETNIVNYTITLDTTTEKSELFVNPMFVIELPSSVESINTANSEFTVNNDGGAFTGKKVFTSTVLGKKYVVVTLVGEQTEESVQNGNTTVNLKLELNVSEDETEGNEITKIYYKNDTVTAYENGASFDTDEVEISLILESEDKEEIGEVEENIQDEDISLTLINSREDVVKQEEEITYTIYVYNSAREEKQNLQINSVIPNGITLQNVKEIIEDEENTQVDYNYNEETRLLTINIDKIDVAVDRSFEDEETGETVEYTKLGTRTFKITVKADNLEEGTFSKEVKSVIKVQAENNIIEEKETVNTISDVFLEVQTENLQENINENEEITLAVKVKNKGLLDASDVNISISLPEEITPRFYKGKILSETGEEESYSEGTLNSKYEENSKYIPAEKTYYIQLIGIVNEIDEGKSITATGTVNGQEFSWTTELVDIPEEPENPTDPEPEEPNNPDNPTNPENPDDPTNPNEPNNPEDPEEPANPDNPTNPENPDEPTNPEDPNDPEDPENPNNPNNPTNPDGPNNQEKPTGPEDSNNQEQITDGFDLGLNQYLNKITVTNEKGTTTYEYKDTNFAKVEIHSKYMNGSKVTLEYKIVVKNKGTIPGYARKIVDYIPKDLVFNSELNKDWYLGDDGNIYSVKLIDKLLNPGETAELSIILEKQMTNENIGTITNLVEIYEASNDENVEDINSIPGDKLDGQNDMSKVEVLIAVSTGTIILYITLAIVVITILGVGFYKVKKVTLNKKGGC